MTHLSTVLSPSTRIKIHPKRFGSSDTYDDKETRSKSGTRTSRRVSVTRLSDSTFRVTVEDPKETRK